MAKNNKTRFYVLYSDKTWVFDQSEHAYDLIYVINRYIYISLNFEKDGSLDFRLKTGAACFQAIGAVWELGGAASRHACVDSRGSEL